MRIKIRTDLIHITGKKYIVKIPRMPSLRAAYGEIEQLGSLCLPEIRNGDIKGLKKTIRAGLDFWKICGPFTGFYVNHAEWKCSKLYPESVVPVRFSFFGLINVLDRPKMLRCSSERFLNKYFGLIEKDIKENAGATFARPWNYGWHQGKLKLLGYGTLEAVEVLKYLRKSVRDSLDRIEAGIKS
jgi:hypothetical protein